MTTIETLGVALKATNSFCEVQFIAHSWYWTANSLTYKVGLDLILERAAVLNTSYHDFKKGLVIREGY